MNLGQSVSPLLTNAQGLLTQSSCKKALPAPNTLLKSASEFSWASYAPDSPTSVMAMWLALEVQCRPSCPSLALVLSSVGALPVGKSIRSPLPEQR